MIHIPHSVFILYEAALNKREIPCSHFADYKKWMRYYLDFCVKHVTTANKSERKQLFLTKLAEKKQNNEQMKQAAHAVSIYFEMQQQEAAQKNTGEELVLQQSPSPSAILTTPAISSLSPKQQMFYRSMRQSQYSVAGYEEKSESPEWDVLISKLADEIKVRHYSRKTLKTYAHWSRQFQRFLKNKSPQELSTADVKEYLTYLAVKCKVAASTQNQAFCLGR
jgi:site-specific recombinase XerD